MSRVETKNPAKSDVAGKAKLLVVLLAFAWGFNWIAAAVEIGRAHV